MSEYIWRTIRSYSEEPHPKRSLVSKVHTPLPKVKHRTAYRIVSFEKILRISGAPHETVTNDNYDAPNEVCGKRK